MDSTEVFGTSCLGSSPSVTALIMTENFRIIRFGLVKMGQLFRYDKRWWMNDYQHHDMGVEVNEDGSLPDPKRRVSQYFDFHRSKVGIKIMKI